MSVTLSQATALLENLLFEPPSLAEANAPSSVAISQGSAAASSVSGLAAAMATSPEASIVEQVARYYVGALGRSPGGSEIAYYTSIAEAGLTASEIASGASAVPLATWNIIAGDFAASPEFNFHIGSGSVVTLLYLNILGRSPVGSEVAYYQNQLNSGYGLSVLLQEFVNSPEFRGPANAQLISDLASYGTAVALTGSGAQTIGVVKVARLPPRASILPAIGEIDCRLDQTILRIAEREGPQRLDDLIANTVGPYVDFVSTEASHQGHRIIVSGIPCSNAAQEEISIERRVLQAVLIAGFNQCLTERAQSAGHGFLDLRCLTDRGDGVASGEKHIDEYHLHPRAIAEAFAHFLTPSRSR